MIPSGSFSPLRRRDKDASDPDSQARRPEEDRDDHECQLDAGEAGEHDYPTSPARPLLQLALTVTDASSPSTPFAHSATFGLVTERPLSKRLRVAER